jgi:hypothetical protein
VYADDATEGVLAIEVEHASVNDPEIKSIEGDKTPDLEQSALDPTPAPKEPEGPTANGAAADRPTPEATTDNAPEAKVPSAEKTPTAPVEK